MTTLDEAAAWDMLTQAGAYLQGHFLLTTGRHSNQFFLLSRLSEHPAWLWRWAQALAARLEPFGAKTVVGPAVGGIIPAFAVASCWQDSRMLFAEKDTNGGMVFKRGFQIHPGEAVVVVEDAVTTGKSVAEVIQAVQQAGGVVSAVGAWVDRSQGPLQFDLPFIALLRVHHVPNWEPEACPLCHQGVPLSRPKGPTSVNRER
ncbi:MAG: orotate phosphoribosyltransferase [Firmicutes bacterium]|nr:orotate phosphoribosyltransferase [Bacillota bacterium]